MIIIRIPTYTSHVVDFCSQNGGCVILALTQQRRPWRNNAGHRPSEVRGAPATAKAAWVAASYTTAPAVDAGARRRRHWQSVHR